MIAMYEFHIFYSFFYPLVLIEQGLLNLGWMVTCVCDRMLLLLNII